MRGFLSRFLDNGLEISGTLVEGSEMREHYIKTIIIYCAHLQPKDERGGGGGGGGCKV